jgi:hypothetical protein
MRAIIPDTLEGALILSVIDFFLSFVIIAGIGVVLSFFPLLNRFVPKSEEKRHGHGEDRDSGNLMGLIAESAAINANHLVAISAVIHAVIGSHRIISVEPDEQKGSFTQKRTE